MQSVHSKVDSHVAKDLIYRQNQTENNSTENEHTTANAKSVENAVLISLLIVGYAVAQSSGTSLSLWPIFSHFCCLFLISYARLSRSFVSFPMHVKSSQILSSSCHSEIAFFTEFDCD